MSNDPLSTVLVAGANAAVLTETDPLQLSCGTGGCVSTCCKASAPIVLNPYEIALLCRESGMSYEDLLDIVDTERADGFPLVLLKRDPACFFWTETGCRVYAARPLACRLFPLGRVYDGIQSRLVLPKQNSCEGLASGPAGSVGEYVTAQDVALHIQMADRWIEFVNTVEQLSLPDRAVTSVAFHMLVYSPDTPPVTSSRNAEAKDSPEESFLLRLDTALHQLPRFLLNQA
jgi:Fe-S-cluster containining protein